MVVPNPWIILPFILLLAAIALMPLLAGRWWSRNYAAVSLGFGAISLGYYLFILRNTAQPLHIAHDYFGFIALVGSLFVVAGGIHVHVKGEATPAKNMLFLLLGALTSNILGTTGAAMLLIRPWIRMNRYRITGYHVAFFIFIVANVGGGLTPIGDPPLFLGYLRGVPFWWVARNGWMIWATGVGILLVLFYILDRINFGRAPRAVRVAETSGESWRFDGLRNLFFLAVILVAVFVNQPAGLREGLMLAAAVGSYFATPKSVHEANHFDFHPVREVAILFAGIFATMMPALDWLGVNASHLLGAHPVPAMYYFGVGGLSAVLDNAPTYLAFVSALSGVTETPDMTQLLAQHASSMLAISFGAVFFGAATYIGNGPNFMVKAIADHQDGHAPTFPGFILRYTLPFLLPMLMVVWWLFF